MSKYLQNNLNKISRNFYKQKFVKKYFSLYLVLFYQTQQEVFIFTEQMIYYYT